MVTSGQRVGEYILNERIGGGAFGEVWRAHHHAWVDQLVAVKIPSDPAYVRSLQSEGHAVHGLQHPNIARAIGFDPFAPIPYLVTEYVPGTSLRPLIERRTLSIPDGVLVLRSTLAGLAFAHERRIVHRDIKPENVLVHEDAGTRGYGAEGMVKLTDFGMGQRTADTQQSIVLSMQQETTRELAGSLDYMSPEQRRGEAVDARADVYACGVMLFELMTGTRPSGTEIPSDLNREVPREIDELFKRSYARLERRFADAGEMLKAVPDGSIPTARHAPVAPAGIATTDNPRARTLVCPRCGRKPGAGDQFCMHCGQQLVAEVRRCPSCGFHPDPSDRFCLHCGRALMPPMRIA